MALMQKEGFQFILRVLNTNVDGRAKVPFALTKIKGIGRRMAFVLCKKADVDPTKRAGELSNEELDRILTVLSHPQQFGVPAWFLNRQRDWKTGKTSHNVANQLDTALRNDLEKMKKIRLHRGLRHYWGLKVRGQHLKSAGRRGKTVGIGKKRP